MAENGGKAERWRQKDEEENYFSASIFLPFFPSMFLLFIW
jgi:hypothetical protein